MDFAFLVHSRDYTDVQRKFKLTVGREIKMSELKGKIKEMEKKLEDSL